MSDTKRVRAWINYPPGESTDDAGVVRDNRDLAKLMAEKLREGKMIVAPTGWSLTLIPEDVEIVVATSRIVHDRSTYNSKTEKYD